MSASLINPEMLLLLERECERYPAMSAFLEERNLSTGYLLSTHGIALIDSALHSDTHLVVECFTLLDTLAFYDVFYSTPNSSLAAALMNSLCNLRAVPEPKMVTNPAAIAEYTTSSVEDMQMMLTSNKPILAMVILSILRKIYYK